MHVLTLFLSAGKSLTWWDSEGLLSREILLYLELLRRDTFDRIQIFTYDAADRALVAQRAAGDPLFGRIDLIAPTSGRGGAAWSILGVMRHRAAIARSRVLKTNQISGAWAAILARLLTGRPLVLRMGYVLSRRFTLNGQRLKASLAALVERFGIACATRVIVTSREAADHFARKGMGQGRVRLLPTYVDTGIFAAKTDYDFDGPAIAVGRMRPQKNLPELLRGCANAGVALTLVGKGEQEGELRALADTLPVPVTFIRSIDNADLAALMARHCLFILPSLHEGLPKVLIEAMATGLVCIGTPIPGITDLIEDGVTGYLTDGFDADAIARAIGRARSERSGGIGGAARARIEQAFGLGVYADAEAAIYAELA
ncbi:glycosyltransferase family 4 protein [Sphingobium algorifonticola]|uniref:Glycosyltransferase n=1 Tax=Sphingobium algorifonticola TaxID=2008318 RepID=A0A437J571_9SPHN|nr:glycosyltransferase family 4 protein [Sphingobium algorifonticola]RVT39906.1 glycosyltransferase [Sphingobium algorifonticola]